MSPITTHVLDTVSGRPAAGVPVRLEFLASGEWKVLCETSTDADGRARNLLPGRPRARAWHVYVALLRGGYLDFFPSNRYSIPRLEYRASTIMFHCS